MEEYTTMEMLSASMLMVIVGHTPLFEWNKSDTQILEKLSSKINIENLLQY